MPNPFNSLSHTPLESHVTFRRPPQVLPERVSSDSPARDVMTDFTKVAAVAISPCAALSEANERMIASSVRLLLVIDQHNEILGLITANDILGEKPMQYLRENGGKREEIFVREIMTPVDKLEAVFMVDVNNATVGDVVETLKSANRQHALVVDLDENRKQVVRGLFSTTQISKQLGVSIEPNEAARTFAELEQALIA